MARLVTLLLVATLACRTEPETAVPEATSDDHVLLLGDVQHLLGEAVASHAAGDRTAAERAWLSAVNLWQTELGPRVGARDRTRALEIEYALGRLGDALRRSGGRAATLHKPLDKALRDLGPWVAVPDTEPETPAVPVP